MTIYRPTYQGATEQERAILEARKRPKAAPPVPKPDKNLRKTEDGIPKFIAYYRLSKLKIDPDGNPIPDPLGIDSQREITHRYVDGRGKLIAEYMEIISGNRQNRSKRYEIVKAMEMARKTGATLIFAYVDRIARDVEFTAKLQNSGIPFVCCDVPGANNMTIGIMAIMAEEYSRSCSVKIKAALNMRKERGLPCGNDMRKDGGARFTKEMCERSIQARRLKRDINTNSAAAKHRAFSLWLQKNSVPSIIRTLNNEGFRAPEGGKIFRATLERWLRPMVAEFVASAQVAQTPRPDKLLKRYNIELSTPVLRDPTDPNILSLRTPRIKKVKVPPPPKPPKPKFEAKLFIQSNLDLFTKTYDGGYFSNDFSTLSPPNSTELISDSR